MTEPTRPLPAAASHPSRSARKRSPPVRRRVAAVGERVDDEIRHPELGAHAHERLQVLEARSARRRRTDESDQVHALRVREAPRAAPRSPPASRRPIASSMRVRSCWMTAPAPRLRCPTSVLPICPSGSPRPRRPPSASCAGSAPRDRRRRASRRATRRCPGRRAPGPNRRGRRGLRWAAAPRRSGPSRRRAMIAANDSGSSDAPPTSAPSTSGSASSSRRVLGLDRRRRRGPRTRRPPPWRGRRRAHGRTRSPPAPARRSRPCRCRSPRSARRRWSPSRCRSGPRSSQRLLHLWRSWRSVSPRSRSSSVSPTQRIGASPAARAAGSFSCSARSVSPNS